uniref:Trypsin-3-like n=1 Tax=Cyprinus carpio TaxID=7962 RepID=A0A8C2BPN8_CYPCA
MKMSAAYGLLLSVALTSLILTGTFGADIINGKKAKKNSMLYMASVQIDGKHKCGGFLINPSYVLTAAHCDKSGNMTVILGTHNISPQGANLKRYTVQNKHKHPSYKNAKTGNDIMLLKLSKKLKTGKGVKTIKMAKSKDKPLKSKTKCQIAGWGQTEQENVVNNLLVTDVSPINSSTCQTMWKKVNVNLPNNVLCAGGYETKSGACQGDSGGPLVCSGTAVGIVSFNLGRCDYPNVPNVYTEISKFRGWINEVIKGGA